MFSNVGPLPGCPVREAMVLFLVFGKQHHVTISPSGHFFGRLKLRMVDSHSLKGITEGKLLKETF